MPDHRQRNLTSSFTATGPREWKVVGGDRVGTRSAAADLLRPWLAGLDEGPPVPWQVAVCGPCLADTIMTRFATVKHQRTVALAKDMNAAADEIVKLRSRAQRESATPPNCAPKKNEPEKSSGLLEDARHCTTSPDGSPLL